jgi:hypothetical protein
MSTKYKPGRTLSKAARVAILFELDRSGYLKGMTLQQIADLFDVGHRSTILRDLRIMENVKEVLPEMRERLKRDYFKDEAMAGDKTGDE